MSNPGGSIDKDKFDLYKKLIEKWDTPATIGGFVFAVILSVFVFLSFIGAVSMSEAVQIFAIGVILFIFLFRYFKELTIGTIKGTQSLPVAPPTVNVFPPPSLAYGRQARSGAPESSDQM